MSDTDILAKMGTDAEVWADEYMDRFADELPDRGNLIGWFANAIEAGRSVEGNAITELANALRLTQEYVGEAMLPRIEGWSWFDALSKYAPDMLVLDHTPPMEPETLPNSPQV